MKTRSFFNNITKTWNMEPKLFTSKRSSFTHPDFFLGVVPQSRCDAPNYIKFLGVPFIFLVLLLLLFFFGNR